MKSGNLVLRGINRFGVVISAGALSCVVRVVASLALRTFRCNGHRVRPHNKGKQYAPSAPDVASLRRCCRR
jgi:hypothetical protein